MSPCLEATRKTTPPGAAHAGGWTWPAGPRSRPSSINTTQGSANGLCNKNGVRSIPVRAHLFEPLVHLGQVLLGQAQLVLHQLKPLLALLGLGLHVQG